MKEQRPAPMVLTRGNGREYPFSTDDPRRNITDDEEFWGGASSASADDFSRSAAHDYEGRSASEPRPGAAASGTGRLADRIGQQTLVAAKPSGPPSSSRRGPLRMFASISEEDRQYEAEASSSDDDAVRTVTKAMHRSGSNKFPHVVGASESAAGSALLSEERTQRGATEPRPSSYTVASGHINRTLYRSSDSRIPTSRLSERMHERAARNRGDTLYPAEDDESEESEESSDSNSDNSYGNNASLRSSGAGSGLRSSLDEANDAVAMLTEALATSESYRSESLDRSASRLTPSPGRSSRGPSPIPVPLSSGTATPRVPSPADSMMDSEAFLSPDYMYSDGMRTSSAPRSLDSANEQKTFRAPNSGTSALLSKASQSSAKRATSLSDVRTPSRPPPVVPSRASLRVQSDQTGSKLGARTPPQTFLSSPSFDSPSTQLFEAKLSEVGRRMKEAEKVEDHATIRKCFAEVLTVCLTYFPYINLYLLVRGFHSNLSLFTNQF